MTYSVSFTHNMLWAIKSAKENMLRYTYKVTLRCHLRNGHLVFLFASLSALIVDSCFD